MQDVAPIRSPLVRPPGLVAGSQVGLTATASPVREEFVTRGEAVLRGLGWVPRRAPRLMERWRYTAGTPRDRLADLHELLADPAIDAVFFARGGYGSLPLLEHLDLSLLQARPRVLLGSSDLTALLNHVTARSGLVTFHGPMVAGDMAAGRADLDTLRRLLAGDRPLGAIPAPRLRGLWPGSACGRLVGGCLSLVAALVGTPYEIPTDGALVLLEDVDTRPYQIDRMLTQLRLAGSLSRAAGIVFGEMPGCVQHPDQGYALDDVLRDLTADLEIPVLAGLPSGHVTGPAQTVPLGVACHIRSDPASLEVLEPAVAGRPGSPPASAATPPAGA